MGWNPIGVDGKFARLLSAAAGKNIRELDALDGHRDRQLPAPFTLAQHFPSRIVSFSKAAGVTSINGFIMDNGNGQIDGNDVVLIQIGNWQNGSGVDGNGTFQYVGGRLAHLERGYFETTQRDRKTNTYTHRTSTKWNLPELQAAEKLWAEIQRRRLTRFSDLTAQIGDLIKVAGF